ncbi:MAG: RimK family protein [Candidatus Auribacterota bacterium]|jgi:glutathione synthase/RimK-type ligase-like ATP-grasp enzyme|nr:RimK family protein [Candidatus Auribacterota bacterium]
MNNILIVNNPAELDFHIEGVSVVAAKAYLYDTKYADMRNARIFNLCRSYKYQSTGYYVSLLAEARGHKVFPSVATMQDFGSQTIIRIISSDIDELIQQNFKKLKSKDFILSIYFGKNMAKQYEKLSKHLYNLFQSPLLRARFIFNKKWILQYIAPIPLKEIPDHHKPYLVEFAKEYFSRKNFSIKKNVKYRYDMAILVNPEEEEPPSDKKAIQKFIDAAKSFDICTELITRDDFSRIPEFDALFIRETTAVNHHTYRFSRRAHQEDLVVIDDPFSILKCTNKVYLAELLTRSKIAIPKTLIVHKDNIAKIESELNYPCVLKQPDSSFSQGVIKVDDRLSLEQALEKLLRSSDLIIAQEFTPTEFDWRVGILDRTPLFVCKYYMAEGHWQIYNWQKKQTDDLYGRAQTLPIYQVPDTIVETALKAANLIGDGFYGVDVKEIDSRPVIIEVNDNPSITYGIEDAVLQDKLYTTVMQSFSNRLQKRLP